MNISGNVPLNPAVLVATSSNEEERKEETKQIIVSRSELENVARDTQDKIDGQSDLFTLFPDLDLVMDSIVAGIVSPENALTKTLNFNTTIDYLQADLIQELVSFTKKHSNAHYKIKDSMFKIVKESLFTHGSVINMIIPSNIHETLATINTTPGLEDSTPQQKHISNELFNVLNVTNDINLISNNEHIVAGLEESNDKDITLDNAFKKLQTISGIDVLSLDNIHPENIPTDTPLRIKIPVHAFVPIALPNDSTKLIGGFVLLNENGSFISEASYSSSNVTMGTMLSKMSGDNSILETIKKELSRTSARKAVKLNDENLANFVNTKIDESIKSILNHEGANYISVDKLTIVKQVMFNRILKNQKTKMIYVPIELLETYTFNYRANGTGESLLERVSILTSIRSILLFAKLNAQVKNSIPTVKVVLKIDDDDPRPDVTRDEIINEFMRNRPMELPIGIKNINDLSDWLHKMGYYFKTENKKLPDIDIDIEDTHRNIDVPDDELDKDLKDRIIMSFGATPDIVGSFKDLRFATSAILENALMALRAKARQNQANIMITENHKKLFSVDGVYLYGIEKIIENRVKKIRTTLKKVMLKDDVEKLSDEKIITDMRDRFINSLTITLPEIITKDDTTSKDDVANKEAEIDKALEFYISEDFMSDELVGELGVNADKLKDVIKATMMRKYMASIGYMPEVADIVTKSTLGRFKVNPLEENNVYMKHLTQALAKPLRDLKSITNASNKMFQRFEEGSYQQEEEEEGEENSNPKKEKTEEEETEV